MKRFVLLEPRCQLFAGWLTTEVVVSVFNGVLLAQLHSAKAFRSAASSGKWSLASSLPSAGRSPFSPP